MQILNSILGISLFSTLVLISCGENSLRSRKQFTQSEPQRSTSQLVFGTLNASVAGNISATGNMSIDGGKILVELESSGQTAGIEHMQKVFNLERCPLDTDDTNGDGVIDYQEAIGNASAVLPLTDDLTEEGEYPQSTESGFTYKGSGESTLKSEDLNRRAIIIFGVGDDKEVPETVASAPGMDARASLPISCSLIELEEESQDDDQPTTTTGGMSGGSGGGKGAGGSKGGGKGGHHHQQQDQHQQQQQQQNQKQDTETTLGGDFFTL